MSNQTNTREETAGGTLFPLTCVVKLTERNN